MRLLIVEDAPRLRDTLGKALTRMGHAVDLAQDGNEGDIMGRTTKYDAVVLDRMMPGKDGLEVLRGWRRDGIDTPVLLLTALDGVEEKVRGLSDGADDYLTKPFALAELIARLEALARRRYAQLIRSSRSGRWRSTPRRSPSAAMARASRSPPVSLLCWNAWPAGPVRSSAANRSRPSFTPNSTGR